MDTGIAKPYNMDRKRKRPFLVTLLALVVLSITTIHLVRLVHTVALWDFLSSLPGISPGYLAATGLIGVLVGLPLFWGLWRGYSSAPTATRILAVLYVLYWWLDKLLPARSGDSLANWPFSVVMSAILLLLFTLTFFLPEVKAYFGALHERST
jgi:hypothetical protein